MRKFSLLMAVIFCSFLSYAQPSAITIPAGPVLSNHVNVVNVKTKRIDAGQTVLTDSGLIRAVGTIRFKYAHCQLANRMVSGNTVIDHERITGVESKPIDAFAVYKIGKGKIVSVYFTK